MNRRTFLETSLTAVVASSLPSLTDLSPARRIEHIGLELYTVRHLLHRDFEGTLAQVAATGIEEVEFDGYIGHEPKAIRAILEKLKLSAPSAHVNMEPLKYQFSEVLDAAHILGHKYLVCPWLEEADRHPEGLKRIAEFFNRTGETCRKAGMQFAYHNHDYEFQPMESLGGKRLYDLLLAETDSELVKMEMDLCWTIVGGQDPVDYFNRYPGRFPLVHVKDWKGTGGSIKDLPEHMTDVGSGSIDWKRIFAASEKAGIRHYFIEHDDPKEPMASVRASCKYLQDLRF